MNISRHSFGIALCLVAAIVLALGTQGAVAQDAKPKKVEKEVKVMVDEDGNITVNGEPVSGDRVELEDGTVVMRDEDGKVVVIETEDGGDRFIRKRKRMGGGKDAKVQVWRMKDGDDEFVWQGDGLGPEHMAMRRMHGFDGMLGRDFDFDFDFEHMNPEIMEMESASRKLAREVREATGTQKAEKERELAAKLSEIFDRKLENRQKRIAKLQERLEKQRSELEERQSSRSRIIERRKSELLGDDTLKW